MTLEKMLFLHEGKEKKLPWHTHSRLRQMPVLRRTMSGRSSSRIRAPRRKPAVVSFQSWGCRHSPASQPKASYGAIRARTSGKKGKEGERKDVREEGKPANVCVTCVRLSRPPLRVIPWPLRCTMWRDECGCRR